MPAPGEASSGDGGLTWQTSVLLMADLVESVQLFQSDEARAIACWLGFVESRLPAVLSRTQGQLVKSTGDGLLARFDSVTAALAAAQALHQEAAELRAAPDGLTRFWLRVAVHQGEVVVGRFDVLGQAVNLTARLCSLAPPGGTVVSATVRDQLRDGVDADLVDLGESFLKHYDEPVRLWRADPPGQTAARPELPPDARWQMRVLFALRPDTSPALRDLGRLLVSELSTAAARAPGWQVLSPLSAGRVGDPAALDPTLAEVLIEVALSGHLPDVAVALQARRLRDGEPIGAAQARWTLGADGHVDLDRPIELLQSLSADLGRQADLHSHHNPLPQLASYQLLLSAVQQLHSTQAPLANRARDSLAFLAERHPRAAPLRYWQAKTEFLSIVQHWAPDPVLAQRKALDHLQRALDIDDQHAGALALRGHILRLLRHDGAAAEASLQQAAESHPNESLAWLFLSGSLAHEGSGSRAREASQRAWTLSPLDPLDFFYLVFASAAHLAADDFPRALALAERSVRLNASHLPGLCALVIAQVLIGQIDDARQTAQRYLRIRPQASVAGYLRAHPQPEHPLTQRDAEALRVAGFA